MDYIAGLLELLGASLLGDKKRIGFICNLIGCIIWVYVAIINELFGLLLAVIPAIVVNFNNYRKWKSDDIHNSR